MGSGGIGFVAFNDVVGDHEEGPEREQWEWKEGNESVILERVEEEVVEEEITPVMRILDDLGSSVELSDSSTMGTGSHVIRRGASNSSAVSSTNFDNPRPSSINASSSNRLHRTHSPASSELTKIQNRHRLSSSHTPNSISSSPLTSAASLKKVDQERKKETQKLRRRTKVVSGAVGALVLAMAGWRVFGGNGGGSDTAIVPGVYRS